MRFRFTGQYTNGHTSINACGVVFEGHEPADVTEESAIARLIGHPEFEPVVAAVPFEIEAVEDPAEFMPVAPKRRGRKPKAAQ